MPEVIECVAQTADICGEGAVWHPAHNAIYWTDINRGLIHRYSLLARRVDTWTFDQPVTALTLTAHPDTLLVVLGGIILLWSPAADQQSDRQDDQQDDQHGTLLYTLPLFPGWRHNDARVDPAGTLWFGTMQNNVAPDGTTVPITQHVGELCSLSPEGKLKTWQQGIGISNTLAWSPDARTMYFGDTLLNTLYAYDYDLATQSIANRRIFNDSFASGQPDGSAIDSEGFLWNCRYGGGAIVRFAPDGSVDRVIAVPVPNPTTCTFGGPGLMTLYFTSAGEGKQLAGPSDGGLFSMEVGVPGHPSTPYCL